MHYNKTFKSISDLQQASRQLYKREKLKNIFITFELSDFKKSA